MSRPSSAPKSSVGERTLRNAFRPLLWLLITVPAAWAIFALFTGRLGAEPVEALEHFTGEWTLRILACCLAITPLFRLTGWGWLVKHRRLLGVAAFCWASMHLLVYVGIDKFFDMSDIIEDVSKHLYVTVGMLAFVLMIPLAATSTDAAIKRLGGKKWKQLHRLVYIAAIAGCIHFLWAVKSDRSEPLVYLAIILALLMARLIPRRNPKPKL